MCTLMISYIQISTSTSLSTDMTFLKEKKEKHISKLLWQCKHKTITS